MSDKVNSTDGVKLNGSAISSRQRDLVVAYLSYALDDVGDLSPTGLRLLQLTIASLIEGKALPEHKALSEDKTLSRDTALSEDDAATSSGQPSQPVN
jgi:hypothetical protein